MSFNYKKKSIFIILKSWKLLKYVLDIGICSLEGWPAAWAVVCLAAQGLLLSSPPGITRRSSPRGARGPLGWPPQASRSTCSCPSWPSACTSGTASRDALANQPWQWKREEWFTVLRLFVFLCQVLAFFSVGAKMIFGSQVYAVYFFKIIFYCYSWLVWNQCIVFVCGTMGCICMFWREHDLYTGFTFAFL